VWRGFVRISISWFLRGLAEVDNVVIELGGEGAPRVDRGLAHQQKGSFISTIETPGIPLAFVR
jgi:hypothetical protein